MSTANTVEAVVKAISDGDDSTSSINQIKMLMEGVDRKELELQLTTLWTRFMKDGQANRAEELVNISRIVDLRIKP